MSQKGVFSHSSILSKTGADKKMRPRGQDYSEDGGEKECSDCNKITANLILNNLLRDHIGDNVTICLSQSLKTWLHEKRIQFTDPSHCTVRMKNIKASFTWDGLDEKIKHFKLKYPRGFMPPTQFKDFKSDVKKVVNLLNEHTNFNQFLAIVAFLKHHPDVNEMLLIYAVTGAELQREDISHFIMNPFEVTSL